MVVVAALSALAALVVRVLGVALTARAAVVLACPRRSLLPLALRFRALFRLLLAQEIVILVRGETLLEAEVRRPEPAVHTIGELQPHLSNRGVDREVVRPVRELRVTRGALRAPAVVEADVHDLVHEARGGFLGGDLPEELGVPDEHVVLRDTDRVEAGRLDGREPEEDGAEVGSLLTGDQTAGGERLVRVAH